MEKLFGTDGVRGIPGKAPLLPETIRDLAYITARLLLRGTTPRGNGSAPIILMGRDTRGSGPALCRHLSAGFAAAGCRVLDLGVVPTPALSYLAPRVNALCGVIVSASHNPAEFNGIKFFSGDGFKMDPAAEEAIERDLHRGVRAGASPSRLGAPSKFASPARDLVALYSDFLRSTFPPTLDLTGLRLVVDCAHGAASAIAPALLKELGAEVHAIGCSPNGRNINAGCGALFPAAMQRAVRRHRADAGVCLDGDADRAVFADETGALLDGDALICLSALRLRRLGLLKREKVVLTVMSNFGLKRFLEKEGIGVVSVPVGDRNVTEAIEREGLSLGGEASGHVIFRSFSPTGDGLLTALQTLAALRESGKPLSWHRKSFRAVPQVLRNIYVERKVPLEELPRLRALIARLERDLKGEGRIFVRYSGTEPLLRIMIEGPSEARVRAMAERLAEAFVEEAALKS
jgi:phosphoglucosamine mutase